METPPVLTEEQLCKATGYIALHYVFRRQLLAVAHAQIDVLLAAGWKSSEDIDALVHQLNTALARQAAELKSIRSETIKEIRAEIEKLRAQDEESYFHPFRDLLALPSLQPEEKP